MLGVGSDDVSIMPVVYPMGRLLSHHSVIFHLLVLILNLLVLTFPYLSDHVIFKGISRIIGRQSERS